MITSWQNRSQQSWKRINSNRSWLKDEYEDEDSDLLFFTQNSIVERKIFFLNLNEKRICSEFRSTLERLTEATHMANWCSSFNAQIEMLRKSFKCSSNWNSHRDVTHYINRLPLFVSERKISRRICNTRDSSAGMSWRRREMSKVKSYKIQQSRFVLGYQRLKERRVTVRSRCLRQSFLRRIQRNLPFHR